MNSSILRQVWTIVEESQVHTLLSLPDQDLVNQLLKKIQEREALSTEDSTKVKGYLSLRTPLIRELAQSRLREYHSPLIISREPLEKKILKIQTLA